MKLATRVAAIFDRALNLLAALAIVIIVVAFLSILTEVVARYFLNRPQVWVVEITEYGLLFVTFLSAAWLLKKDGHVKMDILINRLHPRNKAVINFITAILGAVTCLVIVWASAATAWDFFQTGAFDTKMLHLPKAPLVAVIPVGSFLLAIQFLRGSYEHLRRWKASRNTDESPP